MKVETNYETLKLSSVELIKLLKNKELSYSELWPEMINWIFSPEDLNIFLTKVKRELEGYSGPGTQNIVYKYIILTIIS